MSATEIELARHQWDEGRRALAREAADPARARLLERELLVVSAALARRLGQIFTLAELTRAYADADHWTLALLHEELGTAAPADAATVTDAAFELHARRASDYTP